jgi:hypothetical protein
MSLKDWMESRHRKIEVAKEKSRKRFAKWYNEKKRKQKTKKQTIPLEG